MCVKRLRLPSPFGKTKAAPLSTLLTKAAFLFSLTPAACCTVSPGTPFINHNKSEFITLP
jgi:hypothetical protein